MNTKKYFSTILPPPNLTGTLHLGHTWNAILQDFLIRFHESRGKDIYWGYGLDHAGISLQIRVEAELKKSGIKKNDLTEEEFQEKLWEWKNIHAEKIRSQYKALSLSLPFDEERFTLEDRSKEIVIDVFKRLFRDGLIYRAEKLVNWDPKLQTAISDVEVIYKEEKTKIYLLEYCLVGESHKCLKVATTRPETIFADVALFVHPEDARYQEYIGKKVFIPLIGREIEVLSDEYIDRDFGTGVMKCTPAHDFADWDLGQKHDLPILKAFDETGIMFELAGKYAGMHKDVCKEEMIKDLGKGVEIKDHVSNISYSERSGAKIEPFLSKQWFLKSSLLAKEVIEHLHDFDVNVANRDLFVNCFKYMQDWCISRQLSWGIKIPVWINKDDSAWSVEDQSGKEGWFKSSDVLDTWFSSSLWPEIVFERKGDKYPISILISGQDILLFWISKMIFMSYYVSKTIPFKKIFLHGLVLDSQRRKMSKSLNNGIDPLDLIKEFGNDVVRLFFISSTNLCPANILFHKNKLDFHARFMHKLKNAYSLLKSNKSISKDVSFSATKDQISSLNSFEKWIFWEFDKVRKMVCDSVESPNFSLAFSSLASEIMRFVWDDFCNKYLEIFKLIEKSKSEKFKNNKSFVSFIWRQIIYLLYPLIPNFCSDVYREVHCEEIPRIKELVACSFEKGDTSVVEWFFQYFNSFSSIQKYLGLDRNKTIQVKLVDFAANSDPESVEKEIIYKKSELDSYFALLNNEIVGLVPKVEDRSDSSLFIHIPNFLASVEILFDDKEKVDKYLSQIKVRKGKLNSEIEFLNKRLYQEFTEKTPQHLVDEVREKLNKYQEELNFYEYVYE